MFVASPPAVQGFGLDGTVSTATFTDLRLAGGWTGGRWTSEQLGADSPTFAGYPDGVAGSIEQSGNGLTMTGAGDIAPAVRETLPTGGTVRDILTGSFAALIAVIVVGALFITTEYGSNMIHVSLAVSPRRSRLLMAKAFVLGAVTFVAGVVGAYLAMRLGEPLSRNHGVYIFPVSPSTELRVALGTGAMLAAAAILTLAAGTIFRHSAGAVTSVIVAIVLPYILTAIPFMPGGAANLLAGVTPGAGFAVQQTLVRYRQVAAHYTPYNGYYPLAPWAGFAVLAGYTIVVLAVAAVLLDRRDA